MAQFDVFRAPEETLVVDCQSDFLGSLPTRYVVPLYGKSEADWTFARLTPELHFQEQMYILATPLGAAIDVGGLGRPLGSLAEHRDTILNALDLLLTGI